MYLCSDGIFNMIKKLLKILLASIKEYKKYRPHSDGSIEEHLHYQMKVRHEQINKGRCQWATHGHVVNLLI